MATTDHASHGAPTHGSPGGRRRHRRAWSLLAVPTAGALVAGVFTVANGGAASALPDIAAEAPLFVVTDEGMTSAEAKNLAERAGIEPALEENGAFSFVDAKKFGKIPMRRGDVGRDENRRRTVEHKLRMKRLRNLEPFSENEAIKKAMSLLTEPRGFEVQPRVSHTQLELSDRKGGLIEAFDLDTAVSFDITLDGYRVVGPGNRNRVAFAGDGSVTQLNQSLRHVEQQGYVGIISPKAAQEECGRLYGPNVAMLEPELLYYSPMLGDGSVKFLLPHYSCRVVSEVRGDESVVGRLVPAAPELTPEVTLDAVSDGKSVQAGIKIAGGQEPFRIRWSSSSSRIKGDEHEIAYELSRRGRRQVDETLTATVTDANGIVSSASVLLPGDGGEGSSTGFGGEGGILSVGIENTVDEWQCAQDSANGFRNVMSSRGQSVKFDWRGTNAWERDFKKTSAGGNDDKYVDSVDAQWYTGHGWPGGITFKNTTQSDGSITPSDSRWGDNYNLEWMMLESCQVLADTNGQNDYFGRWAPAFDGLHVLNGFHTNANCIGGGTGATFANYLYPAWWGRPPLTIVQAWGAMANDLEPAGRVWRSISPAKAGWVTNLNDHMWGQGSVGPDIPKNQQIGYVSITGTV